MKQLVIIGGILICLGVISCNSHTHKITSDPTADTPGSGARMTDTSVKARPDSVIIDSTNYGRPRN